MEQSSSILTISSISSSAIDKLINANIAAIRIKDFCLPNICNTVVEKLENSSDIGSFNKATEINRIGMAHFEIDSPEKSSKYHQDALLNTLRLRQLFSPYLSPVDKLRVELEEIWPAGATLENLYGEKCFVGICRIMKPTIELLAHNDRLDRDSPDSMQARSLIGQLSACIYLQVPDKGGELRLWMKEPKSEEEYRRLKGKSYGIPLTVLGDPDYLITPEKGELIIFNTRRYHGVAPGEGKSRINVGLFIGYRGNHMPLSYWS